MAARIFYQKQMTHHFLPEVSRDWLCDVTNCFLIRDAGEVIASYIKKNREPTVEDVGFVQQAEIFDFVRSQTGSVPPVIDAGDVLRDPRANVALCRAMRSASSSPMRCCHGRQARARPTESGQNIGMPK